MDVGSGSTSPSLQIQIHALLALVSLNSVDVLLVLFLSLVLRWVWSCRLEKLRFKTEVWLLRWRVAFIPIFLIRLRSLLLVAPSNSFTHTLLYFLVHFFSQLPKHEEWLVCACRHAALERSLISMFCLLDSDFVWLIDFIYKRFVDLICQLMVPCRGKNLGPWCDSFVQGRQGTQIHLHVLRLEELVLLFVCEVMPIFLFMGGFEHFLLAGAYLLMLRFYSLSLWNSLRSLLVLDVSLVRG